MRHTHGTNGKKLVLMFPRFVDGISERVNLGLMQWILVLERNVEEKVWPT